ncbi:REF/SRPP-like protein [Gossypium australe]|uniref:REF/SRPP-like protein n=1 Tax=Gossypium australe TaxID=47621 RepID=A0A5B6V2Q7_9ROSI|nr:REF/SRPP-like protein [Gossypium australe]
MESMEMKEVKFENKDLKHLGFVRVVAIHALVCVSNLYEYAKQNSGPLRSTVEGPVTTVVGPVYEKFKYVADHLLRFLDKKVDEALHKIDGHLPAKAKQAINQAQYLVHKTIQHAWKLVDEARTNGPRGALHYATAEYKHLLIINSSKLWVKLNHNSAFHSVAGWVTPTAANWSGKYNNLINDMSGKGYIVFGYLPLIPVDEFGEAIKVAKAKEKEHLNDHKSDSSSDSD